MNRSSALRQTLVPAVLVGIAILIAVAPAVPSNDSFFQEPPVEIATDTEGPVLEDWEFTRSRQARDEFFVVPNGSI
ncbi:hypothetical protein [Rhodopirellula bahusiensis]|uniref:hypothetical protein n=1 Tax=Rhodopirellula bahusiensis TaxID=2014065 RepID=UPI003267BDCA